MSSAKLVDATPAEQAAVLAGLRMLQSVLNRPSYTPASPLTPLIRDIFTSDGELQPLAAKPWGERDDFDDLCESINSATGVTPHV